MAYDASGLSLLFDLIGGTQRVWIYRTTDSVGTVDNTDYFALAGSNISGGYGMKVGDTVFVHKTDTPVVYYGYISAVDSDGNATWTALEYASGQATTVTIATAAGGGTSEWDFTVTMKDAAGATVTGVQEFTLWISEAATGIGTTANTYSGGLAAAVGTILDFGGGGATATPTGVVHCLTDANGVFTGTITDTNEPADQYAVVKKPIGSGIVVSAASGTDWG